MNIPSGTPSAAPGARRCESRIREGRFNAGEVLKGVLKPHQCKLFGRECTPEHPIGAPHGVNRKDHAQPITTTNTGNGSNGKRAEFDGLIQTIVEESCSRPAIRFSSQSRANRDGARRRRKSQPTAGGGTVCRAPYSSECLLSRWLTPPSRFYRRRTHRDHDRQFCRKASAFSRWLHRRAGVINGTVNDLAVSGARAEALVCTFVLEAGLPTEILEAEVRAMANAARKAGVKITGGDTKVVEHGKADHMYISTTGIGRPLHGVRIDPQSVRPGDKVLLSGPIGDHGITILLARRELDIEADLSSDTRSVLPLVEAMTIAAGPGIRWMRDPTRGGAATSLNELARDCGLGIALHEDQVPIHDAVRGACELLGLDPLHIVNEGQFLAVVAPEYADAALNALNLTRGGEEACIIGEVADQPAGSVLGITSYGGTRIVDMLVGDPLPRIC